jgi:L-ascorbate metabolism protein UlaG (beta-lactamase superfamily)
MEHMAVVVKLEGRNIFLDPIADKFGEIPKFPGEKIIL